MILSAKNRISYDTLVNLFFYIFKYTTTDSITELDDIFFTNFSILKNINLMIYVVHNLFKIEEKENYISNNIEISN